LIARALGYGLAAVATVGVGLLYGAGSRMVARARRRAAARDDRGIAPVPSASILKPLHGAEPRLADNLATALDQRGYHARPRWSAAWPMPATARSMPWQA
jgi:hypothetical protein